MFTEGLKVIVVGDASVGKTALINRWCENIFNPNLFQNVGVGIIKMPVNFEDKDYLLYIWDTPGQEGYRELTTQSLHDARAAMLVFDITNRSSFSNLTNWIELLSSYEISFIIVGNKSDLADDILVTNSELNEISENNNCTSFIASAFSGDGVELCFQTLAKLAIETSKPFVESLNKSNESSNKVETRDAPKTDPHVVEIEKSSKCTSGKCCK